MSDPATIERLAREAGIWLFEDAPHVEATIGTLRIFAALIAAHERERCATVCDSVAHIDSTGYGIAEDCAAAIRAL